jgi:alcohol dehydrogenase
VKEFFAPTRIVYGEGAIDSIKKYTAADDKFIIVTDHILLEAGVVELVAVSLQNSGIPYSVFADVTPSPTQEIVNAALAQARGEGCNAVIAVGGGSPIDVAKMAAFLLTNAGSVEDYQFDFKPTEAPSAKLICVPTTSGSGSEAGNCSVIVSRGIKCGIARDDLFPAVAIVDPKAMQSMPPFVTATTGMDAFIHAYEAYIGINDSSITDSWAWEAMQTVIQYLPRAYCDGSDLEARGKVALAATMAGIVKDIAGLGLIHASTDAMGGVYHIPHGLANAVVLPYGMRYNLNARLEKHAKLAELFGIPTENKTRREAALSWSSS